MIKLNDGTMVRIDGVRVSRPYGGMMEGLPTKKQNDAIIEDAKRSSIKLWGSRQTHLIEPLRTPLEGIWGHYKDPERMPDYLFQVWLSSWTTFNDVDDGTEVVLIFFTAAETAENLSLAEQIAKQSETFQWKDVAKGFGF
jgi:hypothetical protein